jgi:transposase-like protein
MKANGQKCLNCGQALSKQQIWRNRKYCCRKCFADGHWGKPVELGNTNTRSPKLLEVAELCRSGLTQKEAAKTAGVSLLTVHSWFVRYGTENIIPTQSCKHCGKSMAGLPQISCRKYCSKECRIEAAYLRKHPVPSRMKFDPKLREKGLEMYWGGLGGALIARYLNISADTVNSWIHDFGHLKEVKFNPELIKIMPVNLRIEYADKPAGWRKVLTENAPPGDKDDVVLVCGYFGGRGGGNYFGGIVTDYLKKDPYDGVTYVFCNYSGKEITSIKAINGTLSSTKLKKDIGKFVWPKRSYGKYLKIQKNEFEYLLTLPKSRVNKRYFT